MLITTSMQMTCTQLSTQYNTRRSTIGDRAFAVAGPRAWNSLGLPSDIRTSTSSFNTFKKHLKSYLFQLSFSSLKRLWLLYITLHYNFSSPSIHQNSICQSLRLWYILLVLYVISLIITGRIISMAALWTVRVTLR